MCFYFFGASSSTNLKVGLNNHTGYQGPINKASSLLGEKFLFFGFLPISIAKGKTTQGLRVNGREVKFHNCDANPNSYITLFPNFEEKSPSTYGRGIFANGLVCRQLELLKLPNPSARAMHVDYFMFTELHWGGCGCYGSTGHQSNRILATTIGFR